MCLPPQTPNLARLTLKAWLSLYIVSPCPFLKKIWTGECVSYNFAGLSGISVPVWRGVHRGGDTSHPISGGLLCLGAPSLRGSHRQAQGLFGRQRGRRRGEKAGTAATRQPLALAKVGKLDSKHCLGVWVFSEVECVCLGCVLDMKRVGSPNPQSRFLLREMARDG